LTARRGDTRVAQRAASLRRCRRRVLSQGQTARGIVTPRAGDDPLTVDVIAVYLDERAGINAVSRTCHELWTLAAAQQMATTTTGGIRAASVARRPVSFPHCRHAATQLAAGRLSTILELECDGLTGCAVNGVDGNRRRVLELVIDAVAKADHTLILPQDVALRQSEFVGRGGVEFQRVGSGPGQREDAARARERLAGVPRSRSAARGGGSADPDARPARPRCGRVRAVSRRRRSGRSGARLLAVRRQRRIARGPEDSAVTVWDASAESRYMVLPCRPAGSETLPEEQLVALVTRNGLIGTAEV